MDNQPLSNPGQLPNSNIQIPNNTPTPVPTPNDSESSSLSIFPTLSTVLFILIILAILLILVYYFWYADRSHLAGEDLPDDLIDSEDTIVSIFKKVKDRYGSYTALRYRGESGSPYRTVSYTNYWIYSENFSKRLLYFIGPHPRVAILSFNRPEWFYIHMGTMMSNGVSIGIYPTASPDNCAFIIDHSCVDLLVVENLKQLQKLEDAKMTTVRLILTLDDLGDTDKVSTLIDKIKTRNPNLDIMSYQTFMTNSIFNEVANIDAEIEIGTPHPEDVATIIYTSGTTGQPKGVVQAHSAIITALNSCLYSIKSRSNIDIHIGERFVSYLPLNHIAAQMMDIYVPICSIGTVTFADSDALKGSLKDTLIDVKPTIFIGVPRVWEKIEEGIRKELSGDGFTDMLKRLVSSSKMIKTNVGLDQAKYCIAAAAPLSDSTKNFFDEIGIELCNVYGMSETCGPISIGVPGSSKGAGVPVLDLKIDGETGEILVRGRSLFKNYYKNKKATQDAFEYSSGEKRRRKWFKTGDTGYVDRAGYLHVTGRIKDLIITAGGENISPIPIEDAIVDELKERQLMRYVEHVLVIGNKRKFISVLTFAKKDVDISELERSLPGIIKNINKKAPNSASTVKKHLILTSKLKIGETLTPTLKIKRITVDEKFKDQIDSFYD
jgi:long-chain-fatty-acid--CoA ligase ACSBG